MNVTQGFQLGQSDGYDDSDPNSFWGSPGFTEDPGTGTGTFDDSDPTSFWGSPTFAEDPGNGTGAGPYDTSDFWNGDWFAPSGSTTGNDPMPNYAPAGSGQGGGADVGGILGALKNLFSKKKSTAVAAAPAQNRVMIAGVPVNMAVVGIVAVAAGVLFLTYRSKRRRGRR